MHIHIFNLARYMDIHLFKIVCQEDST